MSNTVALIVIYNHKFDQNIDKVEQLYKDRFSHIYHLVPFYTGEKKNVIAVYENSHFFQGYVAQGFRHYFDASYEHYLFIGDDLLLNPVIDETNYKEVFALEKETAFIPEMDGMPDKKWPHNRAAVRYNPYKKGVEVKNELPSAQEAAQAISRWNVSNGKYPFGDVYFARKNSAIKGFVKQLVSYVYDKVVEGTDYTTSRYPFVRSYSDLFVVPACGMHTFIRYCGVFAATDLWVELAIPTALVLSCPSISTEKDLSLHGRALWTAEDHKVLDRYDFKLDKLLLDFPEGYLYLHPIKLSKWTNSTVLKT